MGRDVPVLGLFGSRHARLAWKLAVSATIFAFIIGRIDIDAVGRAIGHADALYLTLALLLSLVMVVTDALLWKTALQSLGHNISRAPALLYAIVGCFFGSLGPSAMGADLFRAAQMRRLGVPIETTIHAVVVTRLASFASLLLTIASGIPFAWTYHLRDSHKYLFLSTLVIGTAVFGALLLVDPGYARFRCLRRWPLVGRIAALSRGVSAALTTPSSAPMIWASSTSMHLLRVLTFAALAAALHVDVPLSALFAFVPIAMLIAMVPISFASWGMREASLIYFLGLAGVPAEAALSTSVAFGLSRLLMGAIGGIAWMIARSDHYNLKVADASK
jgi:glycosyltransferase 2 family protein